DVRQQYVLRVERVHIRIPDAVRDGVGEDQGDVLVRTAEDAREGVRREAVRRQDVPDLRSDREAVRAEVALDEADREEGDALRLILRREELAGERVAVLEVVRDGRMGAP